MKGFKTAYNQIKYIFDRKQKSLSVILLILTIIGSILECIGVSIIIPVINIIVAPEEIQDSFLYSLLPFMKNYSYKGQVAAIIGAVVVLYIIKNLFFVFLSWFRNKYTCRIQRDISTITMKSYMSRGYEFFLNSNFGQLERGLAGDVLGVYNVVYNFFKLMSDFLSILLVCVVLVVTDWQLTLIMATLALACVGTIYLIFRKGMYALGTEQRRLVSRTGQIVLQCIQGIKDVMILRKQKQFVGEYENAMIKQQNNQIKFNLALECPTYIIEGVCVSGIMVAIGLRVIIGGNPAELMASLAALAVGAFRILPYLSKVSAEINTITQSLPSLEGIYNNIKSADEYRKEHVEVDYRLIKENDADMNVQYFKDNIELKDITFAYGGKDTSLKPILNGVNLKINKGQSIALIGPTGAGKSTLVDVLLGLLVPQNGMVCMDGQNITENSDIWAKTVGYVPQTVFLCDDTIRSNVAFGEPADKIDENRVRDALKRADILEFISSLPDGLDTFVGDRGVRLSGGQRQRIAIARALYHNPDILVLDEATSALDNDTESVIMEAIDSLHGQVTMIIVAHRLTTVRNCDVIYEVRDGGISVVEKDVLFGKSAIGE